MAKVRKGAVEDIYQKKTPVEHILLRPESYIGSVEKVSQPVWLYDIHQNCMIKRDVTYVPGLLKIFDEILVNAADNKQRDSCTSCIKVDIKPEENLISIWNNGRGIPVVKHKTENIYVPTLIFGQLLTSSNFNDDTDEVTGGRNGFGAKLCNVFSTEFTVHTSSKDYHRQLKQTWRNNMTVLMDAEISAAASEDFTCVTFKPDLSKFGMSYLDRDIADLYSKRVVDVAATCGHVNVILNGQQLPVASFKDYVNLYVKNKSDIFDNPLKVAHCSFDKDCDVAVAASTEGFQQISFVNSVDTFKGGTHVDYFADRISKNLVEIVKKRTSRNNYSDIKPSTVKNHVWLFVRCSIPNPTFTSQTKEMMVVHPKSFVDKCIRKNDDLFMNKIVKCGVVDSIMKWCSESSLEKLDKNYSRHRQHKLKGIERLEDAVDAGTKNSSSCVLILTEGDSAKALAVAGLAVLGRDKFGVYPLRGKVLNVRDANFKQLSENKEVNDLIRILGLRYSCKYDTEVDLKSLRYGKVMVMTDQDPDGSHIKGLVINLFHYYWPNLIKFDFIEQFVTPLVKVFRRSYQKWFFSLKELEQWKAATPDWNLYKIKYYKGLGTSTSKEAVEYFSDMSRHLISFRYDGVDDDNALKLAFGDCPDSRKEWISNWLQFRHQQQELDCERSSVCYSDFVNKELVQFSNLHNERSIPSLVDGLKPSQRKVLYTCLQRDLVREIKVSELAGAVSEMSAYHHGIDSLNSTIIGTFRQPY